MYVIISSIGHLMKKEVVTAIRKFGSDILTAAKLSQVDDPTISFNVDDLFALFDNISSSKEMQVGVCNIIWTAIDTNFGKLTDQQKETLKANMIKISTPALDAKSVDSLADATIDLYRKLNNKWPELINFIFNSKPRSPITASLFVRFMATTNSAFQRQKMEKIISAINEQIDAASVPVQTAMIILLAGIGDCVFQAVPEMFEKLWKAAIHVITVDPSRSSKLSVGFEEIYKYDLFKGKTAKAVTEQLNSIKSDWKAATPLLKLIPYLTFDVVSSLFEKLRNIGKSQNKLLELTEVIYQEAPLSDIPEDVFRKLLNEYKSKASDDSHFAVYAALAAVDSDEELLKEIVERKSLVRTVIGLKTLSFMGNDNVDLDFTPEDEVLDKVVELICDTEEPIRVAAYNCLQSLIENDVFIDSINADQVIAQFVDIHDSDIDRFFGLLKCFLNVDGVEQEAVEHIFDFLYITIRDSEKYVKECIDVFNVMASTGNQEMVEAVVDDVLTGVKQLVTSKNFNELMIGIEAMINFVDIAPETVTSVATSILPTILDAAQNSKNAEIKGSAGRFVASVTHKYKLKEQYTVVSHMMSDFLSSKIPVLMKSAAMMGRYMLTEKSVYEALVKSALTTRDGEVLNSLVVTIRKFVKHNKDCTGVELAKLLISGAHPVFNRRPASAFNDPKSEIFTFLATVKLSDIEPTLLRWFDETPFSMMGTYLVAIEKMAMDPKYHAGWAKVLSRRMLNATSYLQEIMLEFILKILRKDKLAMDIHFFISQLLYLWGLVGEEEAGWRAALGSGILELCAMGAEMDEDVVEDILAEYPFDALYNKCESASDSLVKMVDSGKWDSVKGPVALCFSQVLTMSVQKTIKLQLTDDTRNEMARILKQLCNANPAIEKACREQIADNETQMKRFDVLIA